LERSSWQRLIHNRLYEHERHLKGYWFLGIKKNRLALPKTNSAEYFGNISHSLVHCQQPGAQLGANMGQMQNKFAGG
jgi:hypothetical protein